MRISVRVKPRSSGNSVQPPLEPGGDFIVHVTAAPIDGDANSAVIKLLSKHFDVPKSNIIIKSGHTARRKIVDIDL